MGGEGLGEGELSLHFRWAAVIPCVSHSLLLRLLGQFVVAQRAGCDFAELEFRNGLWLDDFPVLVHEPGLGSGPTRGGAASDY